MLGNKSIFEKNLLGGHPFRIDFVKGFLYSLFWSPFAALAGAIVGFLIVGFFIQKKWFGVIDLSFSQRAVLHEWIGVCMVLFINICAVIIFRKRRGILLGLPIGLIASLYILHWLLSFLFIPACC